MLKIFFILVLDTAFEKCPDCKLHMPHFQEAAEYLEKLEDGKVIVVRRVVFCLFACSAIAMCRRFQ